MRFIVSTERFYFSNGFKERTEYFMENAYYALIYHDIFFTEIMIRQSSK